MKKSELKQLIKEQILKEIRINKPNISKKILKSLIDDTYFDVNTWSELKGILGLTEPWMTVKDWFEYATQEEINKAYYDIKEYIKNKNLQEIKINNPNLKIPKGWKDTIEDFDPEDRDRSINYFAAPMEGWDEGNYDNVSIEKHEDGNYGVHAYLAFGGGSDWGPFKTYEEALKKAIKEMNRIKDGWDKEYLEEIKINNPNPQYSFKQLLNLLDLSDSNNSNKKQQQEAEEKLREIGFFDENMEIDEKNFHKNFKTTDGKTLFDLEKWFMKYYT